MRDLIESLDRILVAESTGLANRRPGDQWADPNGNQLSFQDLEFYPDSGRFETTEELQSAVEQIVKKLGIFQSDVVWSNSATARSGGFGLAQFKDDRNRMVYVGRYFEKISPVPTQNFFPNTLPGDYRLQTAAARKEHSGYKPTDILTKIDGLTPGDIAEQIETKFGADSDEAVAVRQFIDSDLPVSVPAGSMEFSAFTNYFAELLQPMALVLGKSYTGNAGDAADKFLTQGGFADCTISFGGTATGGLTDSVLSNSAGETLGISTKAQQGAKASAQNLVDKISQMRGDPDGQKILDQYPEEISLLEMITEGSTPGALNTAIVADIITPEEKNQVLSLQNLSAGDEAIGTGRLSDNLEKMYQERTVRSPGKIVPFYHLRAAIAYRVQDWVNNTTNFSKAASAILNWGAFIQVHSQIKQQEDSFTIEPFRTVYPSTAVTDVLLSAGKTFYSTGSKGNFVFKILYNGAQDTEADVDTAKVSAKTVSDTGDDKESTPDVVARRDDQSDDEAVLGRARRT